MRILVTGVTGQVGSAIVRRFAGRGEIVAAGRDRIDLSRPAELASRLDAIAADLIINPAAYTAVDRAEDERELAFRVNGEAPGIMARWAARRGVPLVHFSTDYVFSGEGERPWREGDPTAPLSAYGQSKLAGEQAIRASQAAHLIVRTSWVYAASGKNFMRTIARLAQERDELRVVADQIGAPTSAALIANTIAEILRESGPDLPSRFAQADGTIHLAATGTTSWHGFAEAIVAGLRERGVVLKVQNIVPVATTEFPAKAARPLNSRLDLTQLARVFGVVPPAWQDALATELDQLARHAA